jgi:hypothetical protein
MVRSITRIQSVLNFLLKYNFDLLLLSQSIWTVPLCLVTSLFKIVTIVFIVYNIADQSLNFLDILAVS